MAHPDHDAEQAYLLAAQNHLSGMLARTAAAAAGLDAAVRGGDADAAAAQAHLRERLASLSEQRAALCFGRIDEQAGDRFYIGRRHVEDESANPIVVDWRAPVAAPFYRATAANPFALSRRRRFALDGASLIAIFEEVFDDPDHPELAAAGGIPDPLLAELERSRAGELRDIVATIQSEQDEIIRAPFDRAVIVQGGPGTGKTAVGLHRAAFLLYEQRAALAAGGGVSVARAQRVLVVGPNPLFLRYISEVLPSLGETAVSQHTISSLAGHRYRIRSVDSDDLAALKGGEAMAVVLENALFAMCRVPMEPVRFETGYGIAHFEPNELGSLLKETRAQTTTFSTGRDVIRRRLEAAALARFTNRITGAGPDADAFRSSLRRTKAFPALLNKLWPTVSAPSLVRRVLSSAAARRVACDGLLTAAEQHSLQRRSAPKVEDESWALADLPLLDEAEALVNGVPATYLHVVVDEAQDLSAMALRMIARRSPSGSMTVLGDLAQSTTPGGQHQWEAVAHHLGVRQSAQYQTLAVGYRLPASILDWANLLLPEVAPGLPASQSVRQGGKPPTLQRLDAIQRTAAVVAAVSVLMAKYGLIGVVAPASLAFDIRAGLDDASIDASAVDPTQLDHAVSVLTPAGAKGLEFDAVVVVEPGEIAGTTGSGLGALYVALTRCVQELVVVHSNPLPAALSTP